jgi:hypothetical protein
MQRIALFCLLMILPTTMSAGGTAYDETLVGKSCKEALQQINCEYKVGKDLEFSIDGVGMPDTGITFVRANHRGDYYASFGLLHGCVIVKHGIHSELFLADYAFVSPKNGKVYGTWQECKTGM